MSKGYLPSTDKGLMEWSRNFSDRITVQPSNYGLSSTQVQAYNAKNTAYASALERAIDPITRTSANVADKNAAREALKAEARILVGYIQADPAITDAQKINLGITVRKTEPTPIPPPATAPALDILSVSGRSVTLGLHSLEDSARRGKPAGVLGADLYTFIGENPPENLDEWTFQKGVTRTRFTFTFDNATPAPAKVWLIACWYNRRAETGPLSKPVSAYLSPAVSQAA